MQADANQYVMLQMQISIWSKPHFVHLPGWQGSQALLLSISTLIDNV